MSTTQVAQKQLYRKALEELDKIAGQTFNDDKVRFEGNAIILPEGTTMLENAHFLAKLSKEMEEPTGFQRKYSYRPWDVAYNMQRTFKRVFGAVSHSGTWLSPPTLIEIPSGPNEVVQVPQGTFSIPHLPDVEFSVGSEMDTDWGYVGVVHAYGPKREAGRINAVLSLIGEELAENSLYRGKAIIHGEMPRFIDTEGIDPDKIVYAQEVQDAIDTHIMARLDYPEALARLGRKFRSKILLEGEYGVGKTEALNLAAKRAAQREITFIMVPKDQQHDLLEAMRTARMYAPAVVAFEDVDTVGGAEQESGRISAVLDAFDGSQAKLSEGVMVLLTTNHVQTLHAGMVRPGRIDTIIHISAPDAIGIQKIIEANLNPEQIDPDMRWADVAAAMEGYHPAFIVQAASNSVGNALMRQARSNDGKIDETAIVVSTDDLRQAGYELRRQWDIHRGAKEGADENRLDDALRSTLTPTVERAVEVVVAERINEQFQKVYGAHVQTDPEKLPRQVS